MALIFLQTLCFTLFYFKYGACDNVNMTESCTRSDKTTLTCHHLPKGIPAGVARVRIMEVKPNNITVTEDIFVDESWKNVTTFELNTTEALPSNVLRLEPMCFRGLERLTELHINVNAYYEFQTNALVGLPFVETFDLSGSFRLLLTDIMTQLQNPKVIPSLKKFLLNGLGIYRSKDNLLDSTFFKALGSRPDIMHMAISEMQISVLNLDAMFTELNALKIVNASYSYVGDVILQKPAEKLHIPEMLDFGYIKLSNNVFYVPPGKNVFRNLSLIMNNNRINVLFKAKTLNISGIISQANPITSVWLYNFTLSLDENTQQMWSVKEKQMETFVARDNRLKYMDIKMICNVNKINSLTNLDLSKNGLEFLHPSILTCSPNLKMLDISSNNLFRMSESDENLFSQLLVGLENLRSVRLASNNLTSLPSMFFGNNPRLEHIDLSSNKLTQIHFVLRELKNLKLLNVEANNIFVLDDVSLKNLNSISEWRNFSRGETQDKPALMLQSNLLSCSSCKSKQFVRWILETDCWSINLSETECTNENGLKELVNDATIAQVDGMCQRPMKIVFAVICTGSAVVFSVIAVIATLKWKKRAQRFQRREKVLQELAQGHGHLKFAVFLSYSSKDDDFVSQNILTQISEGLNEITGVDRDLVCTGDREFRPGRSVYDEIVHCYRQTAVVVAVVSKNFCDSLFCEDEFNLACAERKPIILMLKEHVEENLMSPKMQTLFHKNVRIVWSQENGQLVVSPSWDNICEAILDNIKLE